MTPQEKPTIPPGLCQCGCGHQAPLRNRNNAAKGHIRGTPRLYIHGHNNGRHWVGKVLGSRTYQSWNSMMQRVNNPKRKAFHLYMGRGIKVCERWRNYDSFLEDMGERPEGTSLDRYPDQNGDYAQSNCRWATPLEQSNNTRSNVLLSLGGETHSVSEWERIRGFGNSVIKQRLRLGWDTERAILTPVKRIQRTA